MVWSPQVGAEERHVDGAAQLIDDPRVTHYWDPTMAAGRAFEDVLGTSVPAWDVWMLFGPDARWGDRPPEPDWWEHQLGGLRPDRRLDFDRFARKARGLWAPLGASLTGRDQGDDREGEGERALRGLRQ